MHYIVVAVIYCRRNATGAELRYRSQIGRRVVVRTAIRHLRETFPSVLRDLFPRCRRAEFARMEIGENEEERERGRRREAAEWRSRD